MADRGTGSIAGNAIGIITAAVVTAIGGLVVFQLLANMPAVDNRVTANETWTVTSTVNSLTVANPSVLGYSEVKNETGIVGTNGTHFRGYIHNGTVKNDTSDGLRFMNSSQASNDQATVAYAALRGDSGYAELQSNLRTNTNTGINLLTIGLIIAGAVGILILVVRSLGGLGGGRQE